MVEIKNDRELKAGEKAYWFDPYDNLRGGIIAEIKTSDQTEAKYAAVQLFEEYGTGMMPAKLEKCWPTKMDCLNAEKKRADMQRAEYIESINDVNDLMKFMYGHDLQSEFRDIDAGVAARIRAKDLLGLDLGGENPRPDKNIEVKNENPLAVGDKAWWHDSWGTMRQGTIYDIKDGQAAGKTVAFIHENDKEGLRTGAELSHCWPSEEACVEAEQKRSAMQIDSYKESITGLGSLASFMYYHDLNSENRDYEAVAAVKERAQDLLGIDLDAEEGQAEDFTEAVESLKSFEGQVSL